VMVTLWEDGESTVGHIGERLRLDSGTLSPLLRRLEGAGLVARRRASADERSVIVSVTPRGRSLRRRAAHVPQSICDATGLSTDHQAALVRQLRELIEHLGDA
jgi:MarR family transcriptional regulator, organic hydroperoxide resistance regulator